MSVGLVADAEELTATLGEFKKIMGGFAYTPDNSYRAFVKGDKVAEYGLTALVVGGAAAAATKSGFLKSFWKLILLGIVALGGFVKKLFSSRNRHPESEES